jgi:hypothetical protein
LDCNCCHFSDALLKELEVSPVPGWVVNLAGAGASIRRSVGNAKEAANIAAAAAAEAAGHVVVRAQEAADIAAIRTSELAVSTASVAAATRARSVENFKEMDSDRVVSQVRHLWALAFEQAGHVGACVSPTRPIVELVDAESPDAMPRQEPLDIDRFQGPRIGQQSQPGPSPGDFEDVPFEYIQPESSFRGVAAPADCPVAQLPLSEKTPFTPPMLPSNGEVGEVAAEDEVSSSSLCSPPPERAAPDATTAGARPWPISAEPPKLCSMVRLVRPPAVAATPGTSPWSSPAMPSGLCSPPRGAAEHRLWFSPPEEELAAIGAHLWSARSAELCSPPRSPRIRAKRAGDLEEFDGFRL